MTPQQVISEEELIAVQHYLTICTADRPQLWQALLYGYNGLVLLFGSYLAYETRHVTVEALNDSRLIGMSVYNILLPVMLGIPLVHLLWEDLRFVFCMTMFLIVYPTTATLCFVFIPKVRLMMTHGLFSGDPSSTYAFLERSVRQMRRQHVIKSRRYIKELPAFASLSCYL